MPPAPDHERGFALLRETVRRITAGTPADVLLASTLPPLADAAGADRAAVLIFDARRGHLETRASFVRGASSPSFPPCQVVAEDVASNGIAVLVRDLRDDARYGAQLRENERLIRSLACIPIRDRGVVKGALYLDTLGEPDAFAQHHVDLAGAVADLMALALRGP